MKTFRHGGDRGDLIAGLPALRALGGGVLFIEAAQYTREMLVPERWCGLDRLLKEQPYITNVLQWKGERVDHNLNDWRVKLFRAIMNRQHKDKSLCDWQLEQYGIPLAARDEAWLTVAEPIRAARVVFNRTGPGRPKQHVYQNPLFPWHLVWEKYHSDAVFIGTDDEYRVFCATCGRVPHFKTADLHEAARVIAGADLFVGNQSCCLWLAEGLKKRLVLEVWIEGPNSNVFRPGATQGWDENVVLPDL